MEWKEQKLLKAFVDINDTQIGKTKQILKKIRTIIIHTLFDETSPTLCMVLKHRVGPPNIVLLHFGIGWLWFILSAASSCESTTCLKKLFSYYLNVNLITYDNAVPNHSKWCLQNLIKCRIVQRFLYSISYCNSKPFLHGVNTNQEKKIDFLLNKTVLL